MAIQRALVIRFGGLGDILMATPAVRSLALAYPGIEIDFVVGGGMSPVLAGNPYISRVISFDKRGKDSRLDCFFSFLQRLRRRRYDLTLNLHPHVKAYLMALASRAPIQLTFCKDMQPDPSSGKVRHAIDDFSKELLPLGIHVEDRSMCFNFPPEADQSLRKKLDELSISPDAKLLVINPAASRPLNRWPEERFAEVAAHFAQREDVAVVLTGAPASFRTVMDGLDETGLAGRIAAHNGRIRDLSGKLNLQEFGALLASCSAFLTCDTGPMHIGSALNIPMTVLSGAADPDRTGPLNVNGKALIDRTLDCVPCRDRICRRGDTLCMSNLSVDSVILQIQSQMLLRAGKNYERTLTISA